MTYLTKLVRNNDGATAIEYGLIAGLIAVVIVGAVTLLGADLSTLFGTVDSSIPAG